jgi:hypothetical protein
MSMNATFVQIDEAELSKIQADPSLAELLFQDGQQLMPPVFAALGKKMQERMRAAGPQALADVLKRLDPSMRQQMQERFNRMIAPGGSGDAVLKLMEERRAGRGSLARERPVLSLDKAWHGVHYLLCGEVQPGATLLSQAVMGGVELGQDEGFSGYGPARYLTPAQVAAISQALSSPELEQRAAARFDAARMSELRIYPGWQDSDAEWVMDAFQRLRNFYSDAAKKGGAIVTCLV